MGVAFHGFQQLLQTQQFGIEIRDAVGEVVGGAHGGEQGKGRATQVLGKDGQPHTGQQNVDAH